MKNILICCEFFYPSIGGVQKVVNELAKNFNLSGHNVTIATSKHLKSLPFKEKLSSKLNVVRFEITGNLIRGINGDVSKYQNYILKSKFDYILVYAAQQWTFDSLLPIIKKIKQNIYFAPCGFSGLKNFRYHNYFSKLPSYLSYFNTNILHTKTYRDAIFYRNNNIKNKVLIPNAAGSEFNKKFKKDFFPRYKINSNSINILNVSNYRFAKGQDLSIIIFFFLNIRKKLNLIFIGHDTSSKIYFLYLLFLKKITEFFFKNKKIYFLKKINRKDILSAYASSDIFIFTSRIECSPLVIFEAAASGLPFISLNVGNVNEISRWTKAGSVHNGIFKLLNSLKKLIINKKKLNNLSAEGIFSYKKKFNWKKISKKYLIIFNKFKKQNVYKY
jgi:L-malate glycosyltransferase